jgi:hypothetical protein
MQYARKGKRTYSFGKESLKEREHLEDLDVRAKILKRILKRNNKDGEWIHLAQDRDQWQGTRQ